MGSTCSSRPRTFFTKFRTLALGSALLAASAAPALAEPVKFGHSLRPGVLTSRGDWTVSLDYDLQASKRFWAEPEAVSFRRELTVFAKTDGALAADPDLNTTPLVTQIGTRGYLNLYRPSRMEPGQEPGTFRTIQRGLNWGLISLGLLAGYETDQRLDNRNVTAGAEAGYALTENHGLKALIPSFFVGYDYVRIETSKLQRTLGVDDKDSGRLRVFGSWKLPVGSLVGGAFDPLNAHFDIRYYRSDGLPNALRARDEDDALYTAGALSYSFGPQPLAGFVNALFIRLANGRIPPATKEATTVTLGLTVWER